MSTSFEHWNICAVCGEESKHEKHIAGPEATEDEAQVCSVCGYELAPKLEHTHDFGTEYIGNEDNHWQECECGELSVPEPHVWDTGSKDGKTVTYRCILCDAEKTEKASGGFSWLSVILILLALVCAGGIAAIIILLKRGEFDEDPEDLQETPAEEPEEEDPEEKLITDYFKNNQDRYQ